jgi:predicted ATP-grasp superfamily ATP-dependent carboligase
MTAAEPAAGAHVLIGFADALAAPESAWSLVDGGWKVVAFTRRGDRAPLRHSRAVETIEITAPEDDAARAVAELRALLEKRHFVGVLPLDDAAIWLCARVLGQEPHLLVGPSGELVDFALDKRLQLQAAAEAGLLVPPTQIIESSEGLDPRIDYPVAVKPAGAILEQGGRLRRGPCHICADERELVAVVEGSVGGPLLIQPVLTGVGEGLFGLATDQGILAWSAHRRVRMMNPRGSGSSACRPWPVDDRLQQAAERLLQTLRWRGMFMLEFLRDETGQAWFMELNGRPWGSMALARRQGLEYPHWALSDRRGELGDVPVPPGADFVCRHLGRELVHLLIVLRGRRSVAIPSWPGRWQTLGSVLRVRKTDRWYNWRRGDLRVFLVDAWRTVGDQVSGGHG